MRGREGGTHQHHRQQQQHQNEMKEKKTKGKEESKKKKHYLRKSQVGSVGIHSPAAFKQNTR